MQNSLFYGDNLEVLRKFVHKEAVDLHDNDPPSKTRVDKRRGYPLH